MPRPTRAFFARSPELVARDLLDAVLESRCGGEIVRVRLVETEAYAGSEDPASHAWRGPTPRNATMFGPPGHVYAYRSYGIHTCLNLVCREAGTASGVLMRAAEVMAGVDVARRRRGDTHADRALARGPGNLGVALGADLSLDGTDVLARGSVLRLISVSPPLDSDVLVTPRIGISRAADAPMRFALRGDHHVSGPRSARA